MKTYTIGRGAEAMIQIQCDDDTVERIHAEITVTDDGRYYLVDRCSRKGIKVSTDGEWQTHTEDFVDDKATILLGEYRITVSQLKELAKSAPKCSIRNFRLKRNPETASIRISK